MGSSQSIWMDIPISVHHYLYANEDFIEKAKKLIRSEEFLVSFPKFAINPAKILSRSERKANLIPISKNNFDKKVASIIQHAIGKENPTVILMDNLSHFNVDRLVRSLKAIGIKDNEILVYTSSTIKSREGVEEYLETPNKYLITDFETFGGMKAESGTVLFSDGYNNVMETNLGWIIMDNCLKANVIYKYDDDNDNFINFGASTNYHPRTSVNTNYLNGCKKSSNVGLKCRTCEETARKNGDKNFDGYMLVCKTCTFMCHNGHQYLVKEKKEEEKGRPCECKQCMFVSK